MATCSGCPRWTGVLLRCYAPRNGCSEPWFLASRCTTEPGGFTMNGSIRGEEVHEVIVLPALIVLVAVGVVYATGSMGLKNNALSLVSQARGRARVTLE